jgi:hypothetical protein
VKVSHTLDPARLVSRGQGEIDDRSVGGKRGVVGELDFADQLLVRAGGAERMASKNDFARSMRRWTVGAEDTEPVVAIRTISRSIDLVQAGSLASAERAARSWVDI